MGRAPRGAVYAWVPPSRLFVKLTKIYPTQKRVHNLYNLLSFSFYYFFIFFINYVLLF